jgi:molybdopterin-binding protein
MNISARNALKGKVKHISPEAVNTEVTVELPGRAEVVSIITKASAERLNAQQKSWDNGNGVHPNCATIAEQR